MNTNTIPHNLTKTFLSDNLGKIHISGYLSENLPDGGDLGFWKTENQDSMSQTKANLDEESELSFSPKKAKLNNPKDDRHIDLGDDYEIYKSLGHDDLLHSLGIGQTRTGTTSSY